MKVSISLIIILFQFTNIFAQITDSVLLNQQFIERYKENSELSYTSLLGEIGAPSKYILSGKLTTTYMLIGANSSPISFAIIPDFTVRVRNEKSAGVRTPSFKLGGTTYIRLNKDYQNYKYAELNFTHHSNGQDGSALNEHGQINTYNGNFSTNYLTASYRFGSFGGYAKNKYHSYNYRIGLRWNKWFGYEKTLDNNYGFTRLLYDFSWRKYKFYSSDKHRWLKSKSLEKETLRINAEISYAINEINSYKLFSVNKRLNAELAVNYSLPFMQNVFLMAAVGYYGEDPYNIYFNDKYTFLRFGISTGFIKYKVHN